MNATKLPPSVPSVENCRAVSIVTYLRWERRHVVFATERRQRRDHHPCGENNRRRFGEVVEQGDRKDIREEVVLKNPKTRWKNHDSSEEARCRVMCTHVRPPPFARIRSGRKKILPPGTLPPRGLITMMTGEQPESLASNRTIISTIFMTTINYDRLQDAILQSIILILSLIVHHIV